MIYLVEDDESIRELLVYTLNGQGLVAEGFAYPSDFWHAMEKKIPDLLLDIMLPEEDGLEILQKLRKKKETKNIPIAMLTAKGSEYDVVKGLDGGADDYIPKPFRMMELVSRVKALLRRGGQEQPQDDEEYVLGELYVSKKRHLVKVNGEEVTLTMKEFELLLLFLSNPGIVFSRAQLLDKIWGYQFDGESRTVDVHIRTLRQKLKDAGHYIETVRGIGYKVGGEE